MISHFTDILTATEPYSALWVDAFGVFWGGSQTGFYPGALEAFAALREHGKTIGILSNSTALASRERDKYGVRGLVPTKHYDFLLTSGQLVRDSLLHEGFPFPTPRQTYWVFGDHHPVYGSPYRFLFEGTAYREVLSLEEADLIYAGIPTLEGVDQKDPSVFRGEVARLAASGLPMLSSNPDRFSPEGNASNLVVRQGSITELYEDCGGKVYYFGKPYRLIFDRAFLLLNDYAPTRWDQIMMIGDTPETDIRGGNRCGIATALVLGTGNAAERMQECRGDREVFLQSLPESDRPKLTVSGFYGREA